MKLKLCNTLLSAGILVITSQQVNAAEVTYKDSVDNVAANGERCITFPFRPAFAQLSVGVGVLRSVSEYPNDDGPYFHSTVTQLPPAPVMVTGRSSVNPDGSAKIYAPKDGSSYYYIRPYEKQVCYRLDNKFTDGVALGRTGTTIYVVAKASSFDGLYSDTKYTEYRNSQEYYDQLSGNQ